MITHNFRLKTNGHSGSYIVRLFGKIAIRFHTNVAGAFYQPVRDEDASLFESKEEARFAAKAYGMLDRFTVEIISTTEAQSKA